MAFNYLITKNTPDSTQKSDYWLACVVTFKNRDTYNHAWSNPDSLDVEPIEEEDFLIIDQDIIDWSTTSDKASNIAGFSATLIRTKINYLTNMNPGDWIIFWAFNGKAPYDKVKDLLAQRKRVNHFKNSPKFVGRIESISKDRTIDVVSGKPLITFNLQCAGFSEFDTSMYYNPAISPSFDSKIKPLEIFSDFSGEAFKALTSLTEQISGTLSEGVIEANKAVPFFIKTCLGIGPGATFRNPIFKEGEDPYLRQATQTSPNDTFKIPNTIAKLLLPADNPMVKGNSFTYFDLLNVLVNIQQYNSSSANSNNTVNKQDYSGFQPAEFSPDIIGSMPLSALDFNNTNVWSIIKSYSNDCINEMYVTLRTNNDGYVVPTFVCRQLPFSTPAVNQTNGPNASTVHENSQILLTLNPLLSSQSAPFPNTQFLSLPRWQIDSSVVLRITTGKNNAQRCNYLQLQPWNPLGDDLFKQEANFNMSLPIVDSVDIKRSGLRMVSQQIKAAYISENLKADDEIARSFNKIKADIMFGSHLKLSGSILTEGIQAPICIGDNCVVEDVIYHIERVTHAGSLDFEGNRTWTTTLVVSNGISTESDKKNSLVYVDKKYTDIHEDEKISVNFEVFN